MLEEISRKSLAVHGQEGEKDSSDEDDSDGESIQSSAPSRTAKSSKLLAQSNKGKDANEHPAGTEPTNAIRSPAAVSPNDAPTPQVSMEPTPSASPRPSIIDRKGKGKVHPIQDPPLPYSTSGAGSSSAAPTGGMAIDIVPSQPTIGDQPMSTSAEVETAVRALAQLEGAPAAVGMGEAAITSHENETRI